MDVTASHVRLIMHMLAHGDAKNPTLHRARVALTNLDQAQRHMATHEAILAAYEEANGALSEIRRTHSQPLTSQLAHFSSEVCAWMDDLKTHKTSAMQGAQDELRQNMEAIGMDLASNAPVSCEALQCIFDRRFSAVDNDEHRNGREIAIFASACIGTLLVVLIALAFDLDRATAGSAASECARQ